MKLKIPALLGLTLTLCASAFIPLGTAHSAPARDPKTGKFMKATPAPTSAMKMKMKSKKPKMKMDSKMKSKIMPMRDPKTGRFMKKGAAPAPAPMKKPM